MRRLVLNHRHNIIILSTLEFGSGRRLVGVLLGKYRAKGLKCKTHSEHRTFQDTIADTNKHFVSVNEEGILIRERQTQLRKSQKLYDTRISLFKLNGWMIFIGVHW